MPCIRYVAREYLERRRTGEHVDELVTTGGLDRGGGVPPMIIEQRMNTALVDVSCAMDREAGQSRALLIQRALRGRYSRDAQALLLPGQGAVARSWRAQGSCPRRAAEAGRERQRTMSSLLVRRGPLANFEQGSHVPYRQKERRNMSDLYLQICFCICYGSTVRTPACQPGGREFDSPESTQYIIETKWENVTTTVMSEGWQTSFVVSMCVLFALFKPLLILMCSPSPKRTGGWWQLSGLG
jgi:hypothetical protein